MDTNQQRTAETKGKAAQRNTSSPSHRTKQEFIQSGTHQNAFIMHWPGQASSEHLGEVAQPDAWRHGDRKAHRMISRTRESQVFVPLTNTCQSRRHTCVRIGGRRGEEQTKNNPASDTGRRSPPHQLQNPSTCAHWQQPEPWVVQISSPTDRRAI